MPTWKPMLFERMPKTTRVLVKGHLDDYYGTLGPLSSWTVGEVARLIYIASLDRNITRERRTGLKNCGNDMIYQAQRLNAGKSTIERALAKQHQSQQQDTNDT